MTRDPSRENSFEWVILKLVHEKNCKNIGL